MFYERSFDDVLFRDLIPGHVLVDIPNVYALVMTKPMLITHDLAVVGLRCWTIAGDVLAAPTTALASLDDPDQTRRVHGRPRRRPWQPPQPSDDPFPRDPADRLQDLADRIAPFVDRTDDDPAPDPP
ncbi:hypothetical protein ACIQYZ_13440 [Rhodococcus erythropolis]